MFRSQSRAGHYALLALAHLLMTLPNLGGPALWDMDEGVNAEAGREMLESGNWITPHFNYEIRTAKPALLYWLQVASFWAFGVNEFAARLPAVLCGLGSVWVIYELGRRMYSATTGLLAGLVLASCVEFCLISHAATPDPPLLLFLLLAFFYYWAGSEGGRRWWFVPCAAFCGLAVLTKGPVGVAMPAVVVLLHLGWTRQLRKLWDGRLLAGVLVFILVAGPWYGMVALDTRGKWLEDFWTKENIERFRNSAEGHGGDLFYHPLMFIALFTPWSMFLIPSIWAAVRESRRPSGPVVKSESSMYRFLTVWFLTFLVFFSLSSTKLPNYMLPAYPAAAILVGRWLDGWRLGLVAARQWMAVAVTVGGVLVGVIFALGVMVMSGSISVGITDLHPLPAVGRFAWLGLIPTAFALLFGGLAYRGRRTAALAAFTVGTVATLAMVGGFAAGAMDEYKVPRYAAEEVGLRQTDREIRIATIGWFRHSIVFYCRREVTILNDGSAVKLFLTLPRPGYLLIPSDLWPMIAPELRDQCRMIGRRYDFYSRQEILIVANRYAIPAE